MTKKEVENACAIVVMPANFVMIVASDTSRVFRMKHTRYVHVSIKLSGRCLIGEILDF